MSLWKDVYPNPDFFCFHFQIVVVFYVAIVLLLICTNLQAGQMTRKLEPILRRTIVQLLQDLYP